MTATSSATPRMTAPGQGVPDEGWFDRTPRWIVIVSAGLIGLALWQLVVSLHFVSELVFPGPVRTFVGIVDITLNILHGGYVLPALWLTTYETLVGLLAAGVAGFTIGLLVGETRIGQRALMPYLVGINALPKVAFAPVLVAWFGFGPEMKIAMAMYIAFFPMMIDTIAGLASVDRDSILLFQSFEASRWKTLTKLKLPAALPLIFAGLKTAAVFCVVGAVVGEFMGGGGGLGELIKTDGQMLRIDRVFAYIFYLGALGLILFEVLATLERRIVFWHKPIAAELASA